MVSQRTFGHMAPMSTGSLKVALDMDMLKDVIVDRRVPVQIMLAARADGGVTPGQSQRHPMIATPSRRYGRTTWCSRESKPLSLRWLAPSRKILLAFRTAVLASILWVPEGCLQVHYTARARSLPTRRPLPKFPSHHSLGHHRHSGHRLSLCLRTATMEMPP